MRVFLVREGGVLLESGGARAVSYRRLAVL